MPKLKKGRLAGVLGGVVVLLSGCGGSDGPSAADKAQASLDAIKAQTAAAITDRAEARKAFNATKARIRERTVAVEAEAADEEKDLRADVRSAKRELKRLRNEISGVRAEADRNNFDGDGIYVVGSDVNPGTYKAEATGDNCYYARLSSLNTSDIIDNNNTSGATVVQIAPSDKAISVSGCAEFRKVG